MHKMWREVGKTSIYTVKLVGLNSIALCPCIRVPLDCGVANVVLHAPVSVAVLFDVVCLSGEAACLGLFSLFSSSVRASRIA